MAGNGGRRPGAGRPLGSKNRLPRGTDKLEAVNKLKQMVIEAQEGEYLWRHKLEPFEGNAFDLLRAIYKCNQVDLKTRMYAAAKMIEHEPKVVEQFGNMIEQDDETLDWLIQHLDRLEAAQRQAVPIGELPAPEQPPVIVEKHETAATDMQSLALVPEMPEQIWENGGDVSPVSVQRPRQPAIAPMDNPSVHDDTTSGYPVSDSTAIIVYARPHQNFWIGGKGTITADENGEIAVEDEAIAATLVHAGCKRR